MSDKYTKVRNNAEKLPDNEVRITKHKPLRRYAIYVISQFKERGATEITIRSKGEQMNKIVIVAEIVKHRVKGLYQVNNIGT
jgi:DNA-binding protein Alba